METFMKKGIEMLSLTRKPGESVIVRTEDGTRIQIYCHEFSKRQVRLSFDAPARIRILREEVDRKEFPEDYPAA
jgi:carbon storage regulator CsrA